MEIATLSNYEQTTVKTMFEHLPEEKLCGAILVLVKYYNEQYGQEKAAELINLAAIEVSGKN